MAPNKLSHLQKCEKNPYKTIVEQIFTLLTITSSLDHSIKSSRISLQYSKRFYYKGSLYLQGCYGRVEKKSAPNPRRPKIRNRAKSTPYKKISRPTLRKFYFLMKKN
uniref:(northern house mosquito) hypothetical protein n=1 Tax=Culex pipiens TaxID=7175 RepID=A0A8D8D115_CULPI